MSYRVIGWLLIIFACFYGLGSYPLLDHNEGMYAAIARDMLHSGDFIIPHLNGLPYLEKPPLLFWLMAVSMSVFGEHEWATRLVPALALFATTWMMERFIYRQTKSQTASMAAALIFATALPLLAIGRMVLCDMLMTCFLSAALMGFYNRGQGSEVRIQGRKEGFYGFYFFLALAVLTKGFVAIILAGGTIALFLLWQRRPLQDYLRIVSLRGMLLFLVITTPWHIAASLQEPGFAYFYFINEHVLRFLNLREPHDYYTGHIWYYLPRILGYLAPWTVFLALFARKDAQCQMLDIKKESFLISDLYHLTSFLWSWFFFCLVFFSISGAKANYYMIAGMPPLVMLLALKLAQCMETKPHIIRGLASIALLLIISAIELVQCFCYEGRGDLYPICRIVSWPVIGATALYAIVAIALCWRSPPRWIVLLLGAHVLLLLPLLISGANMAGDRISQKPVAEFLKASSYGEVAVYQEFEELSALAFYMGKPLVIVDSHSSDLLYGQQHSPAARPLFISLPEWISRAPPLPMVILNKRLDSVMAAHHNVCLLDRFERVSVIHVCE